MEQFEPAQIWLTEVREEKDQMRFVQYKIERADGEWEVFVGLTETAIIQLSHMGVPFSDEMLVAYTLPRCQRAACELVDIPRMIPISRPEAEAMIPADAATIERMKNGEGYQFDCAPISF